MAQDVFLEQIKIGQIASTYNGRGNKNVVNYRPISVCSACLSVFKILEGIKYNRIFDWKEFALWITV